MWPQVTQFETRQIEIEAELGLYGKREAAAQAALAVARETSRQRSRWFRLVNRQRQAAFGLEA